MSEVIETNQLSRVFKIYKKKSGILPTLKNIWQRESIDKLALAPTSLKINKGEIVGLVGANGAGKTTLLKILSGLIFPTSGEALVLGQVPWQRKNSYLSKMSILLGQKNQLWWDIPANDSFELLMTIYQLEKNLARKRVVYLAETLACTGQLEVPLRRLSLGERMKMELIGSLLHKPEVLFLDEPTIGLDIVAQKTVREFLLQYSSEEKPTIILTSHYMDDIASLSDRLLLISAGKISYDGTVEEFTKAAVLKKPTEAGKIEQNFEDVIHDFLQQNATKK